MTVADLMRKLETAPPDALVYVDDALVSTPGNKREQMLSILSTAVSEPFAIGSPDGTRAQTFSLIVEDSEYAGVPA